MSTLTAKALHYLPRRANLALALAAIAVQVLVIAFAPIVWQRGAVAFAVLCVAHVYGSILGWLLIHEAIHLKLSPDRSANDRLGRVLAILFGCPFHILKVGHMTHHRYNRGAVDTTELVPHDTGRFGLWVVAYYARILGLLYVGEVVGPLVFFVWRTANRAIRRIARSAIVDGILDLFTRSMVNAIRIDAVLCLALFAVSAWLNRADLWPFALLFAARALAVSYYDNAYHYGTDPVDVAAARNLALPRWLTPLMLNHNLHRTHHRYPAASWAMLPALQARDGDGCDAGLIATSLAQLKGPMRRPAPGTGA